MSRISFKYTVKVWITAAFLSPLLFIIIDRIFSLDAVSHFVTGPYYFILIGIFAGLMFSTPALLLFSFLIWLLNRTTFSDRQKKYILCPVSVLLACLTLSVIFGKSIPDIRIDFILLVISYSIITFLSSFFFNLITNE